MDTVFLGNPVADWLMALAAAAVVVAGLDAVTVSVDLLIPYDRGDIVAQLHGAGEVLSECHAAMGTEMTVRLPAETAERVAPYLRDG